MATNSEPLQTVAQSCDVFRAPQQQSFSELRAGSPPDNDAPPGTRLAQLAAAGRAIAEISPLTSKAEASPRAVATARPSTRSY
jgi:hypothetical protein